MKLSILPVTKARWTDLEAVFTARGCSVARGCWCMFYRRAGGTGWEIGGARAKENKAQMKALVDAGREPGLIAYRDGAPVGWVTLGPREEFKKLERSPVMKAVDDAKVWSIVCFVVPSAERGKGVAGELLRGAIAYAKKRGAKVLEAYPVEPKGRAAATSLWFGALSMYEKAGFTEVARRKPGRPVVRLTLRR